MTFIAKWPVGQSFVHLSRVDDPKYPNRLSFLDERTGKSSAFACDLYSRDYAINLTRMFHCTMGINLEGEKAPHSSCFLPTLCMNLPEAPEVQVALFGRVIATAANPAGEVRGRWGVFNSLNGEEQTFEVEDAVARVFIQNAPKTNCPHMEQILKKGKLIERPALDHYAMEAYKEHFRVVLNRDVDQRILGVLLKQVSLLDKNVVLDENNWAVTLVSAKDVNSGGILTTGHAMIVYEGVGGAESEKAGHAFLKHLHITTNSREEDPLNPGEARLEERNGMPHAQLLNGPTWSRTKAHVEAMLFHMRSGRKIAVKDRNEVNFNLFASMKNWFKNAFDVELGRFDGTTQENCITFCVSILRAARINLREPGFLNPNDYIQSLNSDFRFEERKDDGTIKVVSRNEKKQKEFEAAESARNMANLSGALKSDKNHSKIERK